MLVFMLWQAWDLDYGPKPEIAAIVSPEGIKAKEDVPMTAEASSQPESGLQTQVSVPVSAASTAKTVKVKTDVIALEIDLQGGTVTNLDLLNYPIEKANNVVNNLRKMIGMDVAETNSAPVRLFNDNQEKLFVAQSGLIAGSGLAAAPNHYTVFTNEQDSYTLQPGQDSLTVPITWTDNKGLVITKLFTFKRGSYEITLGQQVKNCIIHKTLSNICSRAIKPASHQCVGKTII